MIASDSFDMVMIKSNGVWCVDLFPTHRWTFVGKYGCEPRVALGRKGTEGPVELADQGIVRTGNISFSGLEAVLSQREQLFAGSTSSAVFAFPVLGS